MFSYCAACHVWLKSWLGRWTSSLQSSLMHWSTEPVLVTFWILKRPLPAASSVFTHWSHFTVPFLIFSVTVSAHSWISVPHNSCTVCRCKAGQRTCLLLGTVSSWWGLVCHQSLSPSPKTGSGLLLSFLDRDKFHKDTEPGVSLCRTGCFVTVFFFTEGGESNRVLRILFHILFVQGQSPKPSFVLIFFC